MVTNVRLSDREWASLDAACAADARCSSSQETFMGDFRHGRGGAIVACILTNCITGEVSM
jgi:hypothetical protein